MHTQPSLCADDKDLDAGFWFNYRYRPFLKSSPVAGGTARHQNFTVSLTAGAPVPVAKAKGSVGLREVAPFLTDAAYGLVSAATLARMIGVYCFVADGMMNTQIIAVSLTCPNGEQVTVLIQRPECEIEQTGFGTAHILHEDETLGLYILEIAPNGAIPAHCHHQMRECELILDDGLLQQGLPVARGCAFDWPLGHVHAYANPTPQPRRILCIDSPRFTPADEVALTPPPPLAPLAPAAHYLA